MPNILQEPVRVNDWLIFESDDIARYSRETVVVASSQTLASGQVFSYDATGKAVKLGTVAPSNVARGVIVEAVTSDATSTPKAAAIVRFAAVAGAMLTFDPALTAPQKTTAITELVALGIVNRASV